MTNIFYIISNKSKQNIYEALWLLLGYRLKENNIASYIMLLCISKHNNYKYIKDNIIKNYLLSHHISNKIINILNSPDYLYPNPIIPYNKLIDFIPYHQSQNMKSILIFASNRLKYLKYNTLMTDTSINIYL